MVKVPLKRQQADDPSSSNQKELRRFLEDRIAYFRRLSGSYTKTK